MQTEANQEFHAFHFPEMHLRGEASDLKTAGHEKAASDMLAAAEALKQAAATPAPLADAELVELQDKMTRAHGLPWAVDISHDVVVFFDENGNGMRPNPYHPICRMEDLEDGLEESNAEYIAAACNAVPGLLARLAALQAFKNYVHQRFDEANIDRHDEQNAVNGCRVGKRFDDLERYMQLTDAQKTREALVAVANGLAEAIDNEDNQQVYEVWRNITDVLVGVDSDTVASLRLVVPPTVKGGQPNA